MVRQLLGIDFKYLIPTSLKAAAFDNFHLERQPDTQNKNGMAAKFCIVSIHALQCEGDITPTGMPIF
jgi:hypothetical protein